MHCGDYLNFNKFFNLFFIAIFAITMMISVYDVDCAPYQELAPRKGHVPVYIRYGDTPLSEIHPKLVEAFHEDEDTNESAISPPASPASAAADNVSEGDLKAAPNEKSETDSKSSTTTESDIASFDVIKNSDAP